MVKTWNFLSSVQLEGRGLRPEICKLVLQRGLFKQLFVLMRVSSGRFMKSSQGLFDRNTHRLPNVVEVWRNEGESEQYTPVGMGGVTQWG